MPAGAPSPTPARTRPDAAHGAHDTNDAPHGDAYDPHAGAAHDAPDTRPPNDAASDAPAGPLAVLRARAWSRLVEAEPPEWVLRHSLAVEALAAAMCTAAQREGLRPDRAVVLPAALLHDVGRSQAQDIRHAGLGADMLRADAPPWDPRVVLAVERHTGAGIDAAEARALGLPVRDYTPATLEERIVAHADNLHSGPRRLGLEELRGKYLAKGLPAAWGRIERLHAALCKELGVDLEALEPAALPAP